ncbi:MAG: hypothetical protein MUP09_11555 [Thiovulaceae bacterium]|nr:hypothetical protein [Sulfurimonadaceae bacterium]
MHLGSEMNPDTEAFKAFRSSDKKRVGPTVEELKASGKMIAYYNIAMPFRVPLF